MKYSSRFPVLLPYTDIDSGTGISINLLNQLFIALVGVTGNIGIEIATCMFKNSIWASTVAIRHSIEEFSNDMETNAKTSKQILDYHFRNILMQTQDYDRYVLNSDLDKKIIELKYRSNRNILYLLQTVSYWICPIYIIGNFFCNHSC